jgi:hypothetical protein
MYLKTFWADNLQLTDKSSLRRRALESKGRKSAKLVDSLLEWTFGHSAAQPLLYGTHNLQDLKNKDMLLYTRTFVLSPML